MSPAGRKPHEHSPAGGPLKALAWALTTRRTELDLPLRKLAERANYGYSALSRVTSQEGLPNEEPFVQFVAGCGLDVGTWKAVRVLAAARCYPG